MDRRSPTTGGALDRHGVQGFSILSAFKMISTCASTLTWPLMGAGFLVVGKLDTLVQRSGAVDHFTVRPDVAHAAKGAFCLLSTRRAIPKRSASLPVASSQQYGGYDRSRASRKLGQRQDEDR